MVIQRTPKVTSFILLFPSLGLHHHLPLFALLAALLLARPPLLADLDEPLREEVAAELAELARLQDVQHVRGQLRAHLGEAKGHCCAGWDWAKGSRCYTQYGF